mmetsp:Transcript_8407/g.21227  ORF Transcript_8407/g.21227 Transcript_8407/m.21227 type:complete len:259 (-) Transcript_8407:246-1022(-)
MVGSNPTPPAALRRGAPASLRQVFLRAGTGTGAAAGAGAGVGACMEELTLADTAVCATSLMLVDRAASSMQAAAGGRCVCGCSHTAGGGSAARASDGLPGAGGSEDGGKAFAGSADFFARGSCFPSSDLMPCFSTLLPLRSAATGAPPADFDRVMSMAATSSPPPRGLPTCVSPRGETARAGADCLRGVPLPGDCGGDDATGEPARAMGGEVVPHRAIGGEAVRACASGGEEAPARAMEGEAVQACALPGPGKSRGVL